MHAQNFQRGFTLLEMGIVIVVIGLITGGILIGQNMIRTAEVQSVLSDFQKYQAATVRFSAQFASLPGDMPDATSHWSGASNGDGDGFIDNLGSGAGTVSEPLQFWHHLQLASEIDTAMTGANGAGAGIDISGNVNAPAGKVAGSIWIPGYDAVNALPDVPATPSSNFMIITGDSTMGTFPAAVLTPGEAFTIDHKIDNGIAGTGEVIGTPNTGCMNGDEYDGTNDNRLCSLIFLNAF